MKVFIDDIRKPPSDDYILHREVWAARKFIVENSKSITELHLDYHLNDSHLNGSDLLEQVLYAMGDPWDTEPSDDDIATFKEEWPLLTLVRFHSSDDHAVKQAMKSYIDVLPKYGIMFDHKPLR